MGDDHVFLAGLLLLVHLTAPALAAPYLPPGQQRQTDFSTVFHSAKGGLIGPLFRHDGGYELDSPNPDGGCYYQFKHYDEGDRITTNESCLNCTCHTSMLMCYLKVCPTVETFGKNCTMEKKPNQCCPVITCPQVPVQLQIMQMTTTPPFPTSTGLMPSTEYGCTIDGFYYPDGVQVPSEPDKPCKLCYCIRNNTVCVMQECILRFPGCKPVFKEGVCCPVRYNCAHDEIEAVPTTTTLALESNETTVLPTTTILPESSGCIHKGEFYADGALIPSDDPCEHCYCMMGNPVCAVQECQSPLDEMQDNCIPQLPPPGKCCPEAYDCPEVLTTVSPSEDTTVTIDALPSTDTTLLQTSKTAESTEETTKTTPFTSVQTTDSPLDTEGATDSSEETEGTTDSSGETDGTADSVVDTIDSNDSLTTTDSSTLTKETTPHIYIEPSEVTTVTPAVTSDATYKPKPSIEATDSPIDSGVTTDSSDTTVTADSSDGGVATDSPVDISDSSDSAGATGVTTDSSDTGVTTDSTTVTKETTPHIYIEPSEVTTTAPLVTSDATYKPKPSIEVTDSSVDSDYTTDSSDTGVTTDSSDGGVATDSPVDTSDSSDSAGATGVTTDSTTVTKETTPHIYIEPSEVTTTAPLVTSDATYKPKPSIEVTDSSVDSDYTTDSSDTGVTTDSSDGGVATDSPVDTSDSSDSAGATGVTTDSSDTGVTTDSTTVTKETTPHIYIEPSEVTTTAPLVTSDATYKPEPSTEATDSSVDTDYTTDSSDIDVTTDSSESKETKETTPHIYTEPSEVTTVTPAVTSDATYKPKPSIEATDSPIDTGVTTDSSDTTVTTDSSDAGVATDSPEDTSDTSDSASATGVTTDSLEDTSDTSDSASATGVTTDSTTVTKETTPHIYTEPSEVTTVTPAVTSDATYKPKPSIEATDSPLDTGVTTDSSDTTVTTDSSDASVATDSLEDTSDTSDSTSATGVTTDSTTVTKETTPHIYTEPSEVTTVTPAVTSDATYKPKPSIEVTDSPIDTGVTTDSSDTTVTADSSDAGVATDSPVDTSDTSDFVGATGVTTDSSDTGVTTDSTTVTKETTPHIYIEPSEVTTTAPLVTSDATYKPKPSIEVTDSSVDTDYTTDSSDTGVTTDSSDDGVATDSPVDTSDTSDSTSATGVTTDSTTETKKTTPHIYTEPSEVTTVAPAVTSDTTYKPKPSIEPTDVDVIIDSSDSGVITDSSESGVTTDSTTVTKETTPHIYIEPSEVTTSAPSVTSDATYKPEPSTESTDSLVDTDYTTDSSDISVTTDYTEEGIDTSVYPETDDKTADYPTATSETTISSTITKETTPHTVDETSIFTTDTPFGTSAVTATSSASTVTSETTDYSEADSNITDSAPDIGTTTDDPSETTEGPKVTEESTVHSYTDLTETTTPASTSVSGRPIVFPGSCSISGTYVPSNSEVSPFGPCQESCLCLDGQVKCNMTACPSPPPAFLRCSPKPPSETECCPTYSCPTVDPEVTELSACKKNGELYMDGEDVPSSDPCDLCFCLRGDIVCAQQECNMPEGTNCVPVEGSSDSCCPTKYNCDVPDMTTTPAEDSSTFPSDTEETITEVPGTMLTGPETSFETRTTLSAESSTITTPIAPSSDPETSTSPSQPSATLGPEVTELPACEKNGEVYMDGEDVPSSDPCDLCSCWSGEIICAHRECEVPEDQNCVPVDDPSDSCCPTKYNCDVPDMTTTPAEDSSDTEETITEVPGTMLTGPETSFETRTTLPGESSTITTPIASSSDPETSTSPSQPSATFGPEVTELPACEKNGEVYMDGEDVPSSDPCDLCSCWGGEIICARRECEVPENQNCVPVEDPSDSCCPTKYNCESTFPSEPVETTTEVSDAMLTQPVTSTHAPSYTVKTSPSSAETGKTTESPEHEDTTESTPEFSETTDSLSVTQETTTHTITEPSEVTTSAPAFTSGATYKPDPPTEATDPPIDADVIIDSSDVGVTTDSTTETKETTPHIYIEPSEVTTVAPAVTSDATYKPKPSIEATDSPIDTGVTTDSSDTTVTTDSTTVTEETTPHTYIDTSDSAGAIGVTTTTVTKETTPHIYIEPSEVTTVAPPVTSDATYKPKPSIEVTDSPIDSSDAGVATDSSVDTSDSSDSAGATGVTTDSSDTGVTTDSTTVTKETTPHIYIEPSEVTTTAPLVTSDATYKPEPSTEATDSSVDTDYTTDSSDTGVTTDSSDGGVATDSPVDTSDSAGATGVTTTTVTKETTPHIYIEPSEVTTVAPHVTNDVTYKPKPSIEATDSPVDTSDTGDSAGATGVTTDSSDDVLTTDSLVDTDYPTDSSDIDSPVDSDVTTVSPSVISEGTDHSVDKDETTTTEMTPGQTDTATNTEGIPGEGSCYFNGTVYPNGASIPPSTPCHISCVCQNSLIECTLEECELPSASQGCQLVDVPGQCCPSYNCTNMCLVNGEEYADGDAVPSKNICSDCYCYQGELICATIDCPPPPASNCRVVTREDISTCCPEYICDGYETTPPEMTAISVSSAGTDDTTTVAPEGTNDTVTIDPEATNDTVTDVPGDTDHTTDDTVTIGPEDADKTTNDYFTVGPEEPGTVTPATGEISESTTAQTASTDKEDFTGCIVEDQQYEDGSSMPLTSDCQKSCRCDNGSVICSRLSCPPQPPAFLRCSTLPANGTCCPVYDCPIFPEDTSTAAPACVEDGVTYLNGEYIPKDSECVDCYCLSGRVVCASLECAAPAPDCITLTHPAGSCCPTQYECFEHPTTDTEVATDTVTTDKITIPVTSTTTSASSVEASTATVSPVVIEAMSSLTTEESEVSAGVVTTELSLASIDTTTPVVSSSTTSETPISTTESKEDVSEGTVISASPSLGSSEQSDSDEKEEGTSAVTQPLPPSTSSSSSDSTDFSPFPSFPTPSNTTHTPMEYDPEACMFNGKVFASAQQIPRDDPCDFCFCFRGDIICLQQTCPPPIPNCFEEAIAGYCCPRFQCPVVQTLVNVTTTTTPIPTYPPIQQEVEMIMCEIGQRYYQHGQIVREASGPCLVCRCGSDGMMDCIPQECKAEPMLRRILSSKYG